MAALLADPGRLRAGQQYLLLCASGKRSLAAARELRKRGLAVRSLADAADRGFEVIDIRTAPEVAAQPAAARHIAMPVLLADPGLLPPAREILLVCASGKRSLAAARELRKRGLAVRSLAGGLQSLEK